VAPKQINNYRSLRRQFGFISSVHSAGLAAIFFAALILYSSLSIPALAFFCQDTIGLTTSCCSPLNFSLTIQSKIIENKELQLYYIFS